MGLIKEKVDYLIKKYETNCPFEIAKMMGIQIQYENLGNILGYYSKNFRIQFIHINELADETKKIFICAHELGHAILHPDTNTAFLKKHTIFSKEKIEIGANRFAVELLLPDYLLSEFKNTNCTIHEIYEANGIPKEFLSLKRMDGKNFLS